MVLPTGQSKNFPSYVLEKIIYWNDQIVSLSLCRDDGELFFKSFFSSAFAVDLVFSRDFGYGMGKEEDACEVNSSRKSLNTNDYML